MSATILLPTNRDVDEIEEQLKLYKQRQMRIFLCVSLSTYSRRDSFFGLSIAVNKMSSSIFQEYWSY